MIDEDVLEMISVGESANKLPEVLVNVAVGGFAIVTRKDDLDPVYEETVQQAYNASLTCPNDAVVVDACAVAAGTAVAPDEEAAIMVSEYDMGRAILSLRPNAFFNASRDYMALFEDLPGLSRDYKRLAVPVRILFGSEDRLLNPDHHGTTLVTRYPQMALKMVEGGHMLPLTHPEDCVAFIRESAAALKDRRFISRASPEVYR